MIFKKRAQEATILVLVQRTKYSCYKIEKVITAGSNIITVCYIQIRSNFLFKLSIRFYALLEFG